LKNCISKPRFPLKPSLSTTNWPCRFALRIRGQSMDELAGIGARHRARDERAHAPGAALPLVLVVSARLQLQRARLARHFDGLRADSPASASTYGPLQTIQIDDGYCSSPGDWLLPNALWPGGLQDAFGRIKEAGLSAGVWVAPFMVGSRSQLFAEHPDWVLRDRNGAPVVEWQNYDASGIPSHIDEETLVLDTTNPEAFEYLRGVFRTLRGWGATFFKTDFMDWGLRDATQYKRHSSGETGVQHYRRVLAMIREEIGEESFWLACIAPFAPFWASRTACAFPTMRATVGRAAPP
jgi:hypothetical protein